LKAVHVWLCQLHLSDHQRPWDLTVDDVCNLSSQQDRRKTPEDTAVHKQSSFSLSDPGENFLMRQAQVSFLCLSVCFGRSSLNRICQALILGDAHQNY
jgi:hypothetical protein